MKYKFISSCVLLIIVYYLFAKENITGANYLRGSHASVQMTDDEKVEGLLMQMEDSLVIIYPGTRNEFEKGVALDPVVIAWSKIKQIELKNNDGLSKDLPIDGATGFGLAFSRVGESDVVVSSFPGAVRAGALAGSASGKKYTINGNYAAFNEMKKRMQ